MPYEVFSPRSNNGGKGKEYGVLNRPLSHGDCATTRLPAFNLCRGRKNCFLNEVGNQTYPEKRKGARGDFERGVACRYRQADRSPFGAG